ncbi:CHAT domain-containing protein, partial [Geitlerinema sp. P-1104]|nr:CHAT domain-containing protein [Geitlerinema sp. P-1104]
MEYLRGEIGADSEGYKRNFNEEWNNLYGGMVDVCLELGRYQDAIEYADRSKARNLVELIATRDAYPGGVIPENIRQQLQSLKLAIYQEERRLQEEENPDRTHLNQLRQQKQQLEPYEPLHFQAMQELLDEETAILEWYILPDKFLTFTLTAQSLNLWTSSQEDLQQLEDWINAYLRDYRRLKSDQWRDVLPQHLEQLPKILHLDEILQNLRQQFPNCQKLILIPHRFLHLFPLHALPVTTEDGEAYLQDLFPKGVAYAPNCQVLQQAQNRQRPHFNRLFAIQNPTQDDR